MARLTREAQRVGFPLMLKADAGGGGKGMRIVERAEDLEELVESCRREALSSFKDDKILMERYVRRARHVELQVFGDSHGNYVSLHERDCSVQRRNQKVLEEAPAPHLPAPIRERMGLAAVQAARAVGYVGAGTVEFMVESTVDAAAASSSAFYFMEMNTRLQVEHPVTEMITGLDLVEWQLRVASGEPLPITDQSRVPPPNGHSVEARVYAENPRGGFLPSPGDLKYVREPPPPLTRDTRLETGVGFGDRISVYYDPMIAKLVVHGETREQALRLLERRLAEFHVAGLHTNIDFVAACVRHPKFVRGGVTTAFIPENADELLPPLTKAADGPFCALGWGERDGRVLAGVVALADAFCAVGSDLAGPEAELVAFRLGDAGAPRALHLRVAAVPDDVLKLEAVLRRRPPSSAPVVNGPVELSAVVRLQNRDEVEVAGRAYELAGAQGEHVLNSFTLDVALGAGGADARVDGVRCVFLRGARDPFERTLCVFSGGRGGLSRLLYEVDLVAPDYAAQAASAAGRGAGAGGAPAAGKVKAAMPSKVTRVTCAVGDRVKEGQPLVTTEAMKMETVLRAPRAGTVSKVSATVGQVVAEGAVLVELS